MHDEAPCPLVAELAARLRASRNELTARWLARIVDRVSIVPDRVFPTDDLLDGIPLLIDGVAAYLEEPARAVAGESAVVAKAMELGALRYDQGFDEHELLKEYEIFGGVLFAFLIRTAAEFDVPCDRSDLLSCAHRLFQAVSLIQQATSAEYVRRMKVALAEREERLRAFNRALTHEFRNRLGATLGAAQILELPDLPEEKRAGLVEIVRRNAETMRTVLDNLLEISRAHGNDRQQRHVRLPDAAAEAARQLRDAAQAAGVEVRLAAELLDVEVNAAAVELCLTNLISNAIKYADPAKAERWVEVCGRAVRAESGAPLEVVVEVRDNGLGVPPEAREKLFTRFFRAHDAQLPHIEGTGLGLSIVRDTVDALGGSVWAEFPEEGSVFAFSVPCRRAADARVFAGRDER